MQFLKFLKTFKSLKEIYNMKLEATIVSTMMRADAC